MIRASTFQPRVERLEDRTVPSFLPGNEFPVDNLSGVLNRYGEVAPAVAAAPDGHFVVTYTLTVTSGSAGGVYAKVFKPDGSVLKSDYQVNPMADAGAVLSSVAVDATGGFVIAWQVGFDAIHAQVYNASGTPVGSTIVVDQAVNEEQSSANVATDAAGDFVVTWVNNSATNSTSVFAKVYSAAGMPLTSTITVGPVISGVPAHVAMDSAGDFAVTWQQPGAIVQNNPTTAVEVQRYNLAGLAQGSAIQVASYAYAGGGFYTTFPEPVIAMDSAGAFVVAWESFVRSGLFAQRFDNTGAAQGGNIDVNQYGAASQAYVHAAMDAGGDLVISWTSVTPLFDPTNDPASDTQSEDGSGSGVYARAFDASGNDLTGEFQVSQYTHDMQATSSAAMDANGDLIFAWQSKNQGPDTWNIFGRQYIQGGAGYSVNPQSNAYIHVDAPSGMAYLAFDQTTAIGAYSNVHSNYTFNLNGVTQTYPDTSAKSATVNAPGSNNTAVLFTNDTYLGADGQTHETREVVSLGQGGGQIFRFDAAGKLYTFLQATGFNTVQAFVGRADSGLLIGTLGTANDFFISGNRFANAYSSFPAASYQIFGAPTVVAYPGSSGDLIQLYDGSGPSTYIVSGDAYSTMSGTDQGLPFFNQGVGFTHNSAIATHGGDAAIFYDSPSSDVFVGNSSGAYMYSDNPDGSLAYWDSEDGFSPVYAFSFNGGTDYAYNYDPQNNHTSGFIVLT